MASGRRESLGIMSPMKTEAGAIAGLLDLLFLAAPGAGHGRLALQGQGPQHRASTAQEGAHRSGSRNKLYMVTSGAFP